VCCVKVNLNKIKTTLVSNKHAAKTVTLITKSDQIGPNLTKSDQIGVNRTKSEIPSTKSGPFFGLAFFLMLIYRELNFDTDCFNAYVTSCSYTN